MKFALIAAFVVFALVQGSQAQDAPDMESVARYVEEVKNKMSKELNDMINTQDIAGQAETFIADQRAKLEPMVAQLQEQLMAVSSNVEQQFRPVADNMREQLPQLVDNLQRYMESLIQQLTEKSRAVGN